MFHSSTNFIAYLHFSLGPLACFESQLTFESKGTCKGKAKLVPVFN